MEKVFITDRKTARKIVDNPEVKRFGEAKHFSASLFNIEGDAVVIVRGNEELFTLEIFRGLKELEGKDKEKVLEKLQEMEESAATGVGMIFK